MELFMHMVVRFKVRLGDVEMLKETLGNAILLALKLDSDEYITIKWP